jgi:chemotaxis protein MotB
METASMKILNIVLGVVCLAAFGTTGMLYSQKNRAVKACEAQVAETETVQSELADLKAKYTALEEENTGNKADNAELTSKLKTATAKAAQASVALDRLQRNQQQMNQQLRGLSKELQEKKQEIGQLSEARRGLISRFTNELRNREVQITQMGDSLSVEMVGGIMFHSGQAGLSDQGKEVLRKVADAIKDVTDRQIRIEGHTDNVPIRRRKDQFETNWELSAARATNVVRYLIDDLGVAPERLEATAMSQYHPVADNDTAEGRAKNRRIVIKLTPKVVAEPAAAEEPAEEPAEKAPAADE